MGKLFRTVLLFVACFTVANAANAMNVSGEPTSRAGNSNVSQTLEKCTQMLNTTNADEYYKIGNAHAMQHKWNLALADYSAAIKADPKYAMAYYRRAEIYFYQKRYDLALHDYS